MDAQVRLAGRTVNRLGMSLAGLRVAGMWGEPAGREEGIRAIRRAVDMGVQVLEVPVPFGPAADLLREARVTPDVFAAARLTQRVKGLDVLQKRLGRTPDLILAPPGLLQETADWAVPRGVVGDQPGPDVVAVRGRYPAPEALLLWCEEHGIPYMATEPAILRAGGHTIAFPAPRSVSEVERVFSEGSLTPPAGGPE